MYIQSFMLNLHFSPSLDWPFSLRVLLEFLSVLILLQSEQEFLYTARKGKVENSSQQSLSWNMKTKGSALYTSSIGTMPLLVTCGYMLHDLLFPCVLQLNIIVQLAAFYSYNDYM